MWNREFLNLEEMGVQTYIPTGTRQAAQIIEESQQQYNTKSMCPKYNGTEFCSDYSLKRKLTHH